MKARAWRSRDGDLVRLARDGDPVAFRLLVERHLPMARARAARLCPQPDDVDDAVQDAFLQAFIALDRLRDPDRFAGWLGGIVANVCRAQRRRPPLTLLGDWPENLHPASAARPALGRGPGPRRRAGPRRRRPARRAAAGRRPALLRRPARRADRRHSRRRQGQPAQGPPPAARVHHRAPPRPHPRRLPEDPHDHRPHRARRPLARTPAGRRMSVRQCSWCSPTTPGTGRCRSGCPATAASSGACSPARKTATRNSRRRCRGDDRPAAARGRDHRDRGDRHRPGPGGDRHAGRHRRPGGTRQVTARLADGLALAVITGAPLAVDDPVMDRLAEPVTGPDLLSPFRSRQPAAPEARARGSSRATWRSPTACAAGGSPAASCARPPGPRQDYSCTTEDGRAILAAAVPEPAGFAFLGQEIYAEDYHGRTVTFRGDLRATGVADRAGLVLRVPRQGRRPRAQRRTPGRIPRTTSPSSPEPATGPGMRSPPRSRPTPATSSSASS